MLRKLIFHKKNLSPKSGVKALFDESVESITMINLYFLLFE
ncbi:hypothetical protein VCHC46B1_1026 [Vibrio cholerae HC-46B1]|nr:hypothetical protein VCHC43B1_1033 [Vibrio cholerae HC-43B1]EJH63506.1 hypothetical protein VCHE45_1110 [Vibrio cholerae HE-45]EKK98978.1 hypothetical protein VCCP1035_1152 [Vibrio cholerae CP1035(8)]EKL03883.1 hypothetical protein VCHC41B1_0999 [Vibrio cholerae HC-41B1]EKL31632.1 hypothetical protein VCHE40_0973 [Vibrio cholerae HE-40]EKL36557.1 hypothetical protein VCHE46_0976 [Vibrio cholerae HE-46]EKL98279.1 hypothetical protein VCHC46B1_1026 [Vibrio cholerae HC-46B1]EKM05075.1 hypoth